MNIKDKVINKNDYPIKVVQFGEGNFLRAFVDYMIDIANEKEAFGGSIAIVKPISFGKLNAFKEQNNLYTVLLRGKENGKVVNDSRIITSVSKTYDCEENYEEYMFLAHLDSLRFVVSNTTEAGIVLDEKDTSRDFHQPIPASSPNFFMRDSPPFQVLRIRGLLFFRLSLLKKTARSLKNVCSPFAIYGIFPKNLKLG